MITMFLLEAFTLEVNTTAGTDILDLTEAVTAHVEATGVAEGLLTLFISGSTAALSTIEFESGVVNDLRAARFWAPGSRSSCWTSTTGPGSA